MLADSLAKHHGGAVMSAFEFFFSFYGVLLGLSLAAIATGLATAIQHRQKIQIGWLTPLLAVYLCLDIAAFWSTAWDSLQQLPLSYGLLVAGLAIALTYFIACSLVFPHQIVDGDRLDDHFWANKRTVLALMIIASLLGSMLVFIANLEDATTGDQIQSLGIATAIYLLLIVPAALTSSKRLFAATIGLCILLYIANGVASVLVPTTPTSLEAAAESTSSGSNPPAPLTASSTRP